MTEQQQTYEQVHPEDPTATAPVDQPADDTSDVDTGQDDSGQAGGEVSRGDLVVLTTPAAYGEQTGYALVLEVLEYDDADGETVTGARVIPLPPEVLAPLTSLERV